MGSKFLLAVAALAVIGMTTPAAQAADPAAVCAGKRLKCVEKLATSVLKCHAKAESKGTVVDPVCVTKAEDKFYASPKGCMAKAAAKGGCGGGVDAAVVGAATESFVVDDIVTALDPFYPAAIAGGSGCSSKKKTCVAKKAGGLLKCYSKAAKKSLAVDAACLLKARDKFDGGANPADGCFAKLELKDANCLTTGDAAPIELVVDTFVEDDAVCVITPSLCSSAPTTTVPTPGVVLQGVLPATSGRFNYNLVIGVPGSDAACNSNFPGSHTCSFTELLAAEAAGDLVGIQDTTAATVTSFWALDATHPNTDQCTVLVAWDYATAHTGQFAERSNLNNAAGTLTPVSSGVLCLTSSWVGCCL